MEFEMMKRELIYECFFEFIQSDYIFNIIHYNHDFFMDIL